MTQVIKSRKVNLIVKDGIGMPGSEEFNTITRRLSAIWASNGKTLNPLTPDECAKFLPSLINVEPSDLTFRKAVETYFTDISVPISLNETKELEVGMIYDDEETYAKEKVTYDDKIGTMTGTLLGTPINKSDYVLYRFALQHPKVANKKEFMYSSDKIWFYIEDVAKEKEEKEKMLFAQNKAREVYFSKVANDSNLLNGILNSFLEVVPIDKLVEDLTAGEKLAKVEEIITKYPNKFVKLSSDENLAFKSLIHLALYKGVLSKIPNTETITYTTDKGIETLGTNVDFAVNFLKQEKNNVIKQQIELRLKNLK
jgi:hypothetical protein